ncbi:MAG: hypothetical protein OEY40_04910, partial [Candidatus Bathyarchaeota archaeon]|nr:hypothetical protein [Candidatus Bathyarchaeota archaeon]
SPNHAIFTKLIIRGLDGILELEIKSFARTHEKKRFAGDISILGGLKSLLTYYRFARHAYDRFQNNLVLIS